MKREVFAAMIAVMLLCNAAAADSVIKLTCQVAYSWNVFAAGENHPESGQGKILVTVETISLSADGKQWRTVVADGPEMADFAIAQTEGAHPNNAPGVVYDLSDPGKFHLARRMVSADSWGTESVTIDRNSGDIHYYKAEFSGDGGKTGSEKRIDGTCEKVDTTHRKF